MATTPNQLPIPSATTLLAASDESDYAKPLLSDEDFASRTRSMKKRAVKSVESEKVPGPRAISSRRDLLHVLLLLVVGGLLAW